MANTQLRGVLVKISKGILANRSFNSLSLEEQDFLTKLDTLINHKLVFEGVNPLYGKIPDSLKGLVHYIQPTEEQLIKYMFNNFFGADSVK